MNSYTDKDESFLHVLWKLLIVFTVCFISSVSFAKAENHCKPIFGTAFKDQFKGGNFDVVRVDVNCNGIVDTVFSKKENTANQKYDLYAYSDANENGKIDLIIRFMPKFLILRFDVNEDGKDDYVGYDYNYDLVIDKYL